MKLRHRLRPSRRSTIAASAAAIAAVAAVTLSGCGAGGPAASGPKTLTVLVEAGGHGELQPIADAYKKDTGTTIKFIELPYDGLYNRVNSELASGSISFDVGALDAIWLPAFKDGLLSMNSFYTDAVKKDNFPAIVDEAKGGGSDYVGVPAFANSEIVYYRTDLFNDPDNKAAFQSQFGYPLAAPTTWQQYSDIAKFFTKDGLYGTGLPGAVETQYLSTLSQAGEKEMVLNSAGTSSTLGDSYSLKALDYYTSLVPFAPPGTASADWNAVQNQFYQGKTAMMQFWAHAYRQVPTSSSVYGKIGVAPLPAGPAGIAGVPGPFYLSIPKATKNQAAAKDFVKFAYDHQALSATTSLGLVARISVMKQFMDEKGYEAYQPMIQTLSAPATISRPANPHWQNIVNNALVPMLQKAVLPGADNAALLKAAAQQVDSIVNK